MILLKIGGEFYIASAWPEDEKVVPSRSSTRLIKTDEDFDYALFEICWHLKDCHEAIEVFGEFEECPVCLSRTTESGNLIHKSQKLVVN